ncbi:MAG: sigma-70 family RNA polymerase sigma factor [Planctomycetes bacterium]|nr:sigma-70 family RNA polymerase sigma factor [Planctomycetota bacterium]
MSVARKKTGFVSLIRAQGPPSPGVHLDGSATCIIGRANDSGLVLDDESVSRRHAVLRNDRAGATIEDATSSLGTLLNGVRLEANEKVLLHDRDVLSIGPWTFVVRTTGEGDGDHHIPEVPPPPAESTDPYQTSATMLLRLRADGTLDRQLGWSDFSAMYGPVIAGFARNAGAKPQEVDDILQDVMLGFFRQSRVFEYDPAKGRFRGYLKRITLNAIRDRHRRKRPGVGLPEDFDPPERESHLSAAWDREWTEHLVRRALEKVKTNIQPKTLEAFDRYGVRGEPIASVASDLGMSEAAIRHAKMRVLDQMRDEIVRMRADEG